MIMRFTRAMNGAQKPVVYISCPENKDISKYFFLAITQGLTPLIPRFPEGVDEETRLEIRKDLIILADMVWFLDFDGSKRMKEEFRFANRHCIVDILMANGNALDTDKEAGK